MPRKHVLFVVIAGHGHVNPTLPLVEELVRRGHRVDFATSQEFADAVTGAGARWVALPPVPPSTPPPRVGPEAVAAWLRHFFAANRATYPVLYQHCVTEHPDGVCYDATQWQARIVAEQLGIPAVRTVPNLASNEVYSIDDLLTACLDDSVLAADCAEFSAEHDVALDFAATMDVTEALNLVFFPREFQPHGDTFDERFQFVGPLLGNRDRPNRGRRPIRRHRSCSSRTPG